MATSSTGDFSESFLHLSLDFTDRLSSADDWTTRSLDDLLSYLQLAKLHDHEAAPERPQTKEPETCGLKFSSQSTPLVLHARERCYSLSSVENSVREKPEIPSVESEKPVDAEALFKALQPYLEKFISQNHVAVHSMWNSDHTNAAGQKLGPKETDTELQTETKTQTQIGQKGRNSYHILPHPQQEGDHKMHENPRLQKHHRRGHLDELDHLDMELRIEDTFDHARRINSDGTIRYGSPGTTPPESSRGSQFVDSRCTMIEQEEMTKPEAAAAHKTREHLGSVAPQLDLPNLTMDHIDLQLPEEPEETVAQLKLQLEQYKQDNTELVNEVRYLRGQSEMREKGEKTIVPHYLLDLPDDAALPMNKNAIPRGSESRKEYAPNNMDMNSQPSKPSSAPEPGPADILLERLTEENVPEEFRPFYHRLQLDKVDQLSEVQKSNMIKNVMLSLLVTDFDHLPSMAPKVGAYLRLSARFLDELHGRLYQSSEMRPLLYLRDYGMDLGNGLEECLAGMLSKIG